MRFHFSTAMMLMALCLFATNGCGEGPAGGSAEKGADEHGHDEHAHDEEGPHGGHIIELGAQKHHAELTHDEESHKVGVYILGEDAKTAAPIEAKSVMINVSADGVPSQFELPAVPQADQSGGQTSYFEIVSEPLCKIVCGESEAKSTQARLSLNIDGKPYVGLIETAPHEHDHDHGHDH
jgi:hypothetical protein